MILQTLCPEEIWFLGSPFFKMYQMVFDLDNKLIGFYTNINESYSENKKIIIKCLYIYFSYNWTCNNYYWTYIFID